MTAVVADLLAVPDGCGDMSGELPALLVTLKADTKLCAIGCCTMHSMTHSHYFRNHCCGS